MGLVHEHMHARLPVRASLQYCPIFGLNERREGSELPPLIEQPDGAAVEEKALSQAALEGCCEHCLAVRLHPNSLVVVGCLLYAG